MVFGDQGTVDRIHDDGRGVNGVRILRAVETNGDIEVSGAESRDLRVGLKLHGLDPHIGPMLPDSGQCPRNGRHDESIWTDGDSNRAALATGSTARVRGAGFQRVKDRVRVAQDDATRG